MSKAMFSKIGLVLLATTAAGAAFSPAAYATDGYQLVGIGQYEMGLAGADVAAPGDPMTAITNPAGVAWIPSQAAFSAEWFNPTRTDNFGFGPIGSHDNIYGVPSVGWVAPAFGKHFYFGGGMFATSGMGVNFLQSVPGATVQAYSNIQFFSMSPALAWRPTRDWAFGVALNVSLEQVALQQTFNGVGLNLSSPSTAFGFGASLGVLHRVNRYVTLGLMYRMPTYFNALTWQETSENFGGVAGNAGQYSTTLNYPQQISAGVAFHPTRQWLISLEGQWINWSGTLNHMTIYGPWDGTSSVTMNTHWHDQFVFNIGMQYQVFKWLAIRGGYSWASCPIGDADTPMNLLLPACVDNTITIGATEQLPMNWSLTEAYMHAFSATINGGPLQPGMGNTSAELTENSFGLQIGYQF